MARSAGPVAALVVLALIAIPVGAVIRTAGGIAGLGAADWAALRFTVWQALVSAALSVGLAIPVARALARRRFRGRSALITLLGAPFVLPVIVAVMGLLAIFGRAGLVNTVLGGLGLPPVSIYGAHGVILAHVFFNLPLAVRMLLHGWLAIPAERFRVAAQLGQPVGRLLEWPMLRRAVPGAFAVIFLVCTTSFAVALILGGGPQATTLELAIYQAVRFEFDLRGAASLALVQLGVCAVALGALLLVDVPDALGAGLDRTVARWDGAVSRDAAMLAAAALFLALPMGAILLSGVPGLAQMPGSVLLAALRSLAVALLSTGLCMALALAIVTHGRGWSRAVAVVPLSVTALVLGTGLFIVVFPFVRPASVALPVTALMNALFALPFAVRILAAARDDAEAQFGRLADGLALRGWARMRVLILPRIRRPLGFAAGLAAALSMGDLGVITLFASGGQETLPLAMFRLMGAYQTEAASGAALLLVTLSLGLFWLFDRGGRIGAET
ncbi:thiamine/thiamine pyrophosphate ABC transporter permease ThiP [Salibaculum halophilum]|uniref:thiamine/thiamine pyrophosphate ABC transporter permease ThiP n=1 Tax=Salibaculum halophilum TaxID=1914408 RepID=UPI000A12196A|nr:thiamine/thiamine pyrophosphate ABC transporter permease ThiP [Salibaculum halophilum]